MPNENIQNGCDVSEYFCNITQMFAEKHIIIETNEIYFRLIAQPDNKIAWVSQKEFVTSNLRNILDQNQMYLKPAIASKNRSQQIAVLYQMLSECAHCHLISVSKIPGFHMIGASRLSFFSSENHPAISNANIGFFFNIGLSPYYYTGITSLTFGVHSVEAAFLIVMRCLSLFMSLNMPNINFYFPYLLILNNHDRNPMLNSAMRTYLCAFQKEDMRIPDLNQPFQSLQSQIYPIRNNVLLLDGMKDAYAIRNENLNLLCDHYVKGNAFNLCAVISSTVQEKLNRSDYLELHLNHVIPFDTWTMLQNIRQFDWTWINTICSCNLDQSIQWLPQYNVKHQIDASKKFNQTKAQNAYVTIMTVRDLLTKSLFFDNLEYFSEPFEAFVSHLLAESTNTLSDAMAVKMFRTELEKQLRTGEIHLLQNQKSNAEKAVRHPVIYHENHTLFIPTKIFDVLCPVKSVKRSLYEQGYLELSNQTYVTKKTIYPPGASGRRMDVYMIRDDIVDTELIAQLTAQNRLQFSRIQTATNSKYGIILGNGIQEQPIIWSYCHSGMPNAHLFITGRSGTGKTTFTIHTIQALHERQEKVIVFDISNSYVNHPSLMDCANLFTGGLPINPMIQHQDETVEACCQRITHNLATVFHLDEKDYFALSDSVTCFMNDAEKNIKSILEMENVSKNKRLIAIWRFIENLHADSKTWKELLDDKKIAVISVQSGYFPYETLTEFLLNDLYQYMETTNDNVFVVIDEIQNMVRSDTSAVIKVLSQGREKGMALISATQSFLSIPRKYKSMFLQSGVSVFFQPEITAVESIAKSICGEKNALEVSDALKKLNIAECLAYGFFENQQHEMEPDTLLYCNCMEKQKKISVDDSYEQETANAEPVKEINLMFDCRYEPTPIYSGTSLQ